VCDNNPDLLKKTWAFSTLTVSVAPAPRIVIPVSKQQALKRAGQSPLVPFLFCIILNMASFFFFLLLLMASLRRLIPWASSG
jgi:hypothetical protein